jgi:hypothetical protein
MCINFKTRVLHKEMYMKVNSNNIGTEEQNKEVF